MNEELKSCVHSSAQSNPSPGYELLVGENWRNVVGNAGTKDDRSGDDGGFPRVLWDNLSSQGYLVLRTRRQHQDGEQAATQQAQQSGSRSRHVSRE